MEAVDPDEGNNGAISYSLRGHMEGMFEVDPQTGAIVTTGLVALAESNVKSSLIPNLETFMVIIMFIYFYSANKLCSI